MYNNFKYNNSRFIPFAGPFLLGALTGGVATQVFRPRPMMYGYYPYNYPYNQYYY